MTNKNLTAIGFVLDRSGSMGAIRDETIGSFNEFLKTQKEAEGDAVVTLAQFDHHYDVIHDYVNIDEVPDLDAETFQPRGYTALLDAIGKTVNSLGAKFSTMEEDQRPGNVIIAVITDGEENRSTEFTRDAIFDMISHQKDKYQWEFIFLGAGQDAIAVGQHYGFDLGKSVSFSTNKVGDTMKSLGGKMSMYRSATRGGASKDFASQQMNYTDSERKEIQ